MGNYKKDIVPMMLDAAQRLGQLAASESFEFWQRKDFRLYVAFDSLSQTEQDRIFNELEVSLLGLFILQFDYAQTIADKGDKAVLKTFQQELVPGFLRLMEETGIAKENLKVWQQLIDMRLKEYRSDLKVALKESSSMEDFAGDEELRSTWARIETITIDCLTYIKRGDVKEGDPLWKLLRKWFITLDARLFPITRLGEKE